MQLEYPLSLKETLCAGILPAGVSLAAGWAFARLSGQGRLSDATRVLVAAVSAVLGARLVAVPGWIPASHWQWLPACGIVVAAFSLLTSRSAALVLAGYVSVSGVAAWLLVPAWDDLPLPRLVLVVFVAATMVAVALSLRLSKPGQGGPADIVVVLVTFVSAMIVLLSAGSLRLALVGMSSASSVCGLLLARVLTRSRAGADSDALLSAVWLVGMLAARRLNSETGLTLWCFVLPPVAPLLFRAAELSFPRRFHPGGRRVIGLSLSLLAAATAAGAAIASLLRDTGNAW